MLGLVRRFSPPALRFGRQIDRCVSHATLGSSAVVVTAVYPVVLIFSMFCRGPQTMRALSSSSSSSSNAALKSRELFFSLGESLLPAVTVRRSSADVPLTFVQRFQPLFSHDNLAVVFPRRNKYSMFRCIRLQLFVARNCSINREDKWSSIFLHSEAMYVARRTFLRQCGEADVLFVQMQLVSVSTHES